MDEGTSERILNWRSGYAPKGKLFDAKGEEITELVYWCNLDTGEVHFWLRDEKGLLLVSQDGSDLISGQGWYAAPLTFLEDTKYVVLNS